MRTFSSTDAKNHSCELMDTARLAPVAVTKYEKPFAAVTAVEGCELAMALAEPAPRSAKRKMQC